MARKRSQRIQKINESPVLLKRQGFFFYHFRYFLKTRKGARSLPFTNTTITCNSEETRDSNGEPQPIRGF